MAIYEVDYEYIIPEYGVTEIYADSYEEAEEAAIEHLSQTLDPEIKGISIESIREKKQQ